MNEQDERFFLAEVMRSLDQAPDPETLLRPLSRLFPGCRYELQLHGSARPLNPLPWTQTDPQQGRYAIEWPELGSVKISTSAPLQSEQQRGLERCLQLLRGPITLLQQRQHLTTQLDQLQQQNQKLQTDSRWLSSCFQLLQRDMLDASSVLTAFTPLLLETCPQDRLLLSPPPYQQRHYLQGQELTPWPDHGEWLELFQTAGQYGRTIHYDSLQNTRFDLPDTQSLTVSPLAFEQGVLCRLGTAGQSEDDLRHFQIGARLLGYLLKLASLHGEVVQAYHSLQESEILRAQAGKLAAIGQIAAGVAHEMNNPLASVGLVLQLAQRGKPLPASSLEAALQALQRCKEITGELLSFSRQSAHTQSEPLDLQEIARRCQRLGSDRIHFQAAPEALPVFGNPGQFQEILMHLLDNAQWAAHKRIDIECRREGDQAQVHIRDDGPGVAEADRSRIFDPFFTTRPMGEAAGLGLTLAQRLAHTFSAEIRHTPPSTFTLSVPLYQP